MSIFIHFKGANGHKAAAYAKTQLPILIDQSKDQILSDPLLTLKEIFNQVNEGMNSDSKIDTYMSGTTAGIVIIYQDKIISANVGDTRIVLVESNGIAKSISMYLFFDLNSFNAFYKILVIILVKSKKNMKESYRMEVELNK